MRILFYQYGSICEPDIIAGFEELGHTVYKMTLEITKKDVPSKTRIRLLHQKLMEHSFDFVFSVNFYPFISEVCNIYGLLYLCWTVDCPVMELLSFSVRNKCNRIFLFDMAQYRDTVSENPECIFHLPLATNPNRWNQAIQNAPAPSIQKYSGDVSFVGSLYTEKSSYGRLQPASDYLKGYLQGIMDAQQKIYGYYFLEEVLSDVAVREFREHFPGFYLPPERAVRNDRAAMAGLYLCSEISAMERVRTMTSLGRRFSVDLYTGSDTSSGIPVQNHGLVKTLTEMPVIFHYSKINLNITAKAIREGLPLRIFDVLGCGGFLLTNYQTELASYFTPGTDLDCYGSEEELLEKTEYYLTHEQTRKEIARNGYETVKKYHTYPIRLTEMLSLAFSVLNS